MALRLQGFSPLSWGTRRSTHLNPVPLIGYIQKRTYKIAKESKEKEKEAKIDAQKYPIKFPIDVGASFRTMPPSIALGLDLTGKTSVGFSMLDHRANLLNAGSIETKGMTNTYKKAKYVRNRLEDELDAAKEKMKKLLVDNYETEFPNTSNNKKKHLTDQEKQELAKVTVRGVQYVSAVPIISNKTEDLFGNFVVYECFNLCGEEAPNMVEMDSCLSLLNINDPSDMKKSEINKLVFDALAPLTPNAEWVYTKTNELEQSNFGITNAHLLAHYALRNHLLAHLTRNHTYFNEFRKHLPPKDGEKEKDKEKGEKEKEKEKGDKVEKKDGEKEKRDGEKVEHKGEKEKGEKGEKTEHKGEKGEKEKGEGKDVKETRDKETKDTKDTKETGKDPKETKETKEQKDKETKEHKETKDTKEKATKDTKEIKEDRDTKSTNEGERKEEKREEKKEEKEKKYSHEEITHLYESALKPHVNLYYRKFITELREETIQPIVENHKM